MPDLLASCKSYITLYRRKTDLISMGYLFMGFLISGVTLSIGEPSALVPLSGGVIRPASYFVDPAFSFAQGWNVTYQYLISIPAEISAASVIVQFWITVNNAIWVTVFSAILFASNIFLVRIYGEIEFTLAILKVCLIVGMNIMVSIRLRFTLNGAC